MKSPFPPKTRMCHCTGFSKSCFDLVVTEEACQQRWINIKGANPQNKDEVFDNWGCVEDFNHILHLSAIDHSRMAAAETEALRNALLDRASLQQQITQRNARVANGNQLQQIEAD